VSTSASAHHGFGRFDPTRDIEIEGTLTGLDFVNPHSYVYFDVIQADGTVLETGCEMRAATVLRRSGWSPELFVTGVRIKVTGNPHRDDPASCYAETLAIGDAPTLERYEQLTDAPPSERVNHDILMDRVSKRIDDAGVIRLIRAYLNAGIMDGGVVVDRHLGTPQGGPLSPLLANVLLDEVDKALEARGYSFARYADDCNVYVGSIKAGERVMAYLRKLYGALKLQINEAKSAVASAFGRKFLGYELWVTKGGEVRCAVAKKALNHFKARIRQLTGRSGGRSMAQTAEKLRPYVLGWKAYFGLAQTPRVWRALDEGLRHRLRAIKLKDWKRSRTTYRELKALGASEDVAKQVASNCHRWWRNSNGVIKTVLTIAYFDGLGVPRLS
jgi:hypothetical protein